jgi:hypothetical protein
MIYQWKDQTHLKADVQKVGERIEKLREANGGLVTPELLVRDGRSARSPLHPCFEWDDGKAAVAYREEQARYVMRHIVVKMEEREDAAPTRAFVSVRVDDDNAYTSIAHAMSDADLRKQILQRAWRELQSWHSRYQEYEELSEVFSAIERTNLEDARVRGAEHAAVRSDHQPVQGAAG